MRQVYLQAAQAVSQQRTAAAARLSEAITAGIQQLGMQGGRFLADVQTNTQAGPHGVDTVDFLVAGHAGSSLHPVAKVASGGELSRLALAIAVTTSQLGSSETLIFPLVPHPLIVNFNFPLERIKINHHSAQSNLIVCIQAVPDCLAKIFKGIGNSEQLWFTFKCR